MYNLTVNDEDENGILNKSTADQFHTRDSEQNSNEQAEEQAKDHRGSLVGFTADTWEEIYEAYVLHSKAVGFGVRKSSTRYTQGKNKKLKGRVFLCNRQGFRCSTKKQSPIVKLTTPTTESTPKTQGAQNKKRKKRKQRVTRTGCKAYLRAKINEDGTWEVDDHILAHNHQLSMEEHEHMHRSNRKVTEEKAEAIDLMLSAGLKPTQAFNLMVKEAGGTDSVGHSIIDHYNYISRQKMKEIEGGDAQNVIDNMYQRQSEDQQYFFRFKIGGGEKANKLTAIFWRDAEMFEDYNIYGDVVIFDTTFRTNKYNLICAPIVGINNHWQTIMFGCAFIADETEETFQWVLNTFKKSMAGKEPKTLFTDQDLAMSNAISKVS